MDLIIQMLPPFMRKFSTHMDFVGQRKAERLLQVVILAHGVVGFLLGFFFEQISYMVYTILFGTAVASFLVLPPWPIFRKNPLNWQPATVEGSSTPSGNNDAQKPAGNVRRTSGSKKGAKENKKQK